MRKDSAAHSPLKPETAATTNGGKPPGASMHITDCEEKKGVILAHETEHARQLALHVIEKPVPRVWMIFIPIFFVFYFWKLKQYERGLKEFAENHLLPRRRMLEAVFAAETENLPVDFASLVGLNGGLDENVRALCREWLEVLDGHFRLLFAAQGDNYPALVRSAYRNKSNYQLFCRRLGNAETACNLALLPKIDGDTTILHQITQTMAEGMSTLRKKETEEIFS